MKPYSAEQLEKIVEAAFSFIDHKKDSIKVVAKGSEEFPHDIPTPKSINGYGCVYLFYCPDENKYLKIGKAGASDLGRALYKPYKIYKGNRSTFAKSLLNDTFMTSKYPSIKDDVSKWIRNHTYRYDIVIKHIDNENPFALGLVESLMHYLCNPYYEG